LSFHKKTIRDIDVKNKRVLVRTMLNVPIKDNKVTDSMRLRAAKPTIDYLLDQGASLVLISHHSDESQSFEPVADILTDVLGHAVKFVPSVLDGSVERAVKSLKPLDILLLENLRFHSEEEANDDDFAKILASYADVFVQDDFTACHRPHASFVGIPKYLPAVAGLAVEREVDTITKALENPKRPFVAVTGGAKVSTKIPILSYLLKRVDKVFVGGAMANTFLEAQGKEVGKSLVEPEQIELATQILEKAKSDDKELLLPVDVVVAKKIDPPSEVRTVDVADIGKEEIIADIGPKTVDQLNTILQSAGTVIWNGPAGIFETKEFSEGTRALADRIIKSGAYSLVGGGDTCSFVDNAGLSSKFSFVSTGGGASLELMSGHPLPGVEALLDKES
jgi:phosphoglycerate kinase